MTYDVSSRPEKGRDPGRRQRAQRLSPSERKRDLLSHALSVFAKRGIAGARHADIAAEAKVSVPTVFTYFPTRVALVEAVLAEVERFYLSTSEQAHVDETLPAPQVILQHARIFADSVDHHSDYARIWLEWSSALRDESWPRYQDYEDRIVAILARTLERGQREGSIDPLIASEDGAHIAIGAAHMIAQMKLSGRDPATLERFEQAVVKALTGGLATTLLAE